MSVFARLSRRSRLRKKALLQSLFPLGPQTRVLEIGAETGARPGGLLQLADWYPWKSRITALNLRPAHLTALVARHPEVTPVAGDACRLPYLDKVFDLVHANAVIEHLGTAARQAAMAREVMRVGRNWFVTTPNRAFPFEFHMRLPLVSWLPTSWMRRIGHAVSYSHAERSYRRGRDLGGLRLLRAGELAALFPASRVYRLRVTFWPETLVAAGGADCLSRLT